MDMSRKGGSTTATTVVVHPTNVVHPWDVEAASPDSLLAACVGRDISIARHLGAIASAPGPSVAQVATRILHTAEDILRVEEADDLYELAAREEEDDNPRAIEDADAGRLMIMRAVEQMRTAVEAMRTTSSITSTATGSEDTGKEADTPSTDENEPPPWMADFVRDLANEQESMTGTIENLRRSCAQVYAKTIPGVQQRRKALGPEPVTGEPPFQPGAHSMPEDTRSLVERAREVHRTLARTLTEVGTIANAVLDPSAFPPSVTVASRIAARYASEWQFLRDSLESTKTSPSAAAAAGKARPNDSIMSINPSPGFAYGILSNYLSLVSFMAEKKDHMAHDMARSSTGAIRLALDVRLLAPEGQRGTSFEFKLDTRGITPAERTVPVAVRGHVALWRHESGKWHPPNKSERFMFSALFDPRKKPKDPATPRNSVVVACDLMHDDGSGKPPRPGRARASESGDGFVKGFTFNTGSNRWKASGAEEAPASARDRDDRVIPMPISTAGANVLVPSAQKRDADYNTASSAIFNRVTKAMAKKPEMVKVIVDLEAVVLVLYDDDRYGTRKEVTDFMATAEKPPSLDVLSPTAPLVDKTDIHFATFEFPLYERPAAPPRTLLYPHVNERAGKRSLSSVEHKWISNPYRAKDELDRARKDAQVEFEQRLPQEEKNPADPVSHPPPPPAKVSTVPSERRSMGQATVPVDQSISTAAAAATSGKGRTQSLGGATTTKTRPRPTATATTGEKPIETKTTESKLVTMRSGNDDDDDDDDDLIDRAFGWDTTRYTSAKPKQQQQQQPPASNAPSTEVRYADSDSDSDDLWDTWD